MQPSETCSSTLLKGLKRMPILISSEKSSLTAIAASIVSRDGNVDEMMKHLRLYKLHSCVNNKDAGCTDVDKVPWTYEWYSLGSGLKVFMFSHFMQHVHLVDIAWISIQMASMFWTYLAVHTDLFPQYFQCMGTGELMCGVQAFIFGNWTGYVVLSNSVKSPEAE